MKRAKLAVLALVAFPLFGFWGCLHTTAIHVSDFTQFLAALNQLGIAT